jgi:hypothetical protein
METEEQARARITGEVIADPAFEGAPQIDIDAAVEARLSVWRTGKTSTDDTGTYNWLDDLPPEYIPRDRVAAAAGGDRISRMTGQPSLGRYSGRGLVDSRGGFVKNPDGSTKVLYGPTDVQSIWRGIGFEERKQISSYMKAFGVYGGSTPSLNLDQLQDFNAFARVLYTANQEGTSWDTALETLAKRYQDLPKKGGTGYKPTSIADIKRAIQQQASDLLGRELTPEQVMPLAQRVQQRETTVQTQSSAQRAPSTSSIIENKLKKEFKPEEEAFGIASYIEQMLQL